MAQARLERLMNVVAYLTETRRPLTLREIVETVPGYPESISAARRAFERDKEELRAMNFDVALEETPNGESGYRIHKENTYFDVKLNSAQRSVVEYALSLYGPEKKIASNALTKLGGMNPENEIVGINSLPMPEIIDDIYEIISKKKSIEILFKNVKRKILPRKIIARSGFWYLEAFDLDKKQSRTFRIDRIEKMSAFEDGANSGEENIDDVLLDEDDETIKITVQINPSLVDHFCQTWNAKQGVEKNLATFTVTRPEIFLARLFDYSGFVTVVDPPEVRKLVEDSFKRARELIGTES